MVGKINPRHRLTEQAFSIIGRCDGLSSCGQSERTGQPLAMPLMDWHGLGERDAKPRQNASRYAYRERDAVPPPNEDATLAGAS